MLELGREKREGKRGSRVRSEEGEGRRRKRRRERKAVAAAASAVAATLVVVVVCGARGLRRRWRGAKERSRSIGEKLTTGSRGERSRGREDGGRTGGSDDGGGRWEGRRTVVRGGRGVAAAASVAVAWEELCARGAWAEVRKARLECFGTSFLQICGV
ncbi:hypothetical protein Nepgr_011634 [Nepenthes gracilis]|uniref:Uncharacterized protein n=1 Tax=Nepenthes gracilis TaxID=150966 RepID=A0AAD3XM42_NEPGR|nr:hypothetical protein Nepgr_011634 [Nepenthes gracilis]